MKRRLEQAYARRRFDLTSARAAFLLDGGEVQIPRWDVQLAPVREDLAEVARHERAADDSLERLGERKVGKRRRESARLGGEFQLSLHDRVDAGGAQAGQVGQAEKVVHEVAAGGVRGRDGEVGVIERSGLQDGAVEEPNRRRE